MLWGGRLLASAALLATMLIPQAALAAPRGASTTTSDPLTVTIDSLSPPVLSTTGSVTVTGTVTNTDDVAWTTVNVYMFMGWGPMVTSSELADAAASDSVAPVGNRVLNLGDFTTIDEIDPGQTTPYTVTVPRADLPASTSGVYWFGIQALGQTEVDGRDASADGVARTFLPLVIPPTQKPVKKHHKKRPPFAISQREPVALVVPIRAQVVHDPGGTVADVDDWTTSLGHEGRLGTLLDLASAVHSSTLLVDPAVVSAVQQLANGNQPLLTVTPPDDSSDDKSDATSDSDSAATQQAASAWISELTALASSHQILELPFGDTDLAGATDQSALYATARARGIAVFDHLGLDSAHVTQVNAPADGVINASGLSVATDNALMLLSDSALADDLNPTVPVRAEIGSTPVITTSGGAAAGGPGPDDPLAPVALRQRILAEAAVRQPTQLPLVVLVPDDFRTGSNVSDFADGLNQPWIKLRSLSAATRGQQVASRTTHDLTYPGEENDEVVPDEAFDAAQTLIDAGTQLQDVVPDADNVANAALDTALASIGYEARGADASEVEAAASSISDQLDQISIGVPAAVTLSSDSGHFSAVVANGLDQPATIRLAAVSDPAISFSKPTTIKLGAHERTTVLLSAQAERNGVHQVRLYLTDGNGRQFGTVAFLPVRVAQVSRVIWAFIAAGVGLLAIAIAVRLIRRIRRSRSAA